MWTKENISDQTGKTAIVTGANSGIGFETAKALYEKGANVIFASRDLRRGQLAIDTIRKNENAGKIELAVLDLSSLSSVKAFVDWFRQDHTELNILVNNAGIMAAPRGLTAEGFELHFGVNFLGHFALTGHLFPLMKDSADSRIVTVTSLGYTLAESIDFENLKSEKSYDRIREYNQSKFANILFSIELQRRITAKRGNVLSVASHPGMSNTNIGRHMTAEVIASFVDLYGAQMEPWQGALSTIYAAVSPDVKGGELYGGDIDGGLRGYPAVNPIADIALDEAAAKKLWEAAEEYTGIGFP